MSEAKSFAVDVNRQALARLMTARCINCLETLPSYNVHGGPVCWDEIQKGCDDVSA